MSDDVFEIMTTFGDVAELGQGYVNRADGERILLPLPTPIEPGDGVRFIVHLADGTPAFAGAGRCAQVSDQGGTVPDAERFETLLDSLAFDERSRPVYDYIVAVRQAVYAAGGPEADLQQEVVEEQVEEVVAAAPEDSTAFVDSEQMQRAAQAAEADLQDAGPDSEATRFIQRAIPDEAIRSDPPEELEALGEEAPELASAASEEFEPAQSVPADEPEMVAAIVTPVVPSMPVELPVPVAEPLPKGMLKRASLGAHWQPAAPRPPRPMRGTGLFRYDASGLPVPSRPARPALDPSLWVQPAPSPGA